MFSELASYHQRVYNWANDAYVHIGWTLSKNFSLFFRVQFAWLNSTTKFSEVLSVINNDDNNNDDDNNNEDDNNNDDNDSDDFTPCQMSSLLCWFYEDEFFPKLH